MYTGAVSPRALHERAGPLELAVPRTLRDIARDHHRVGTQVGNDLLQRLDLSDVGDATEVEVGDVEQLHRHDSTCTV